MSALLYEKCDEHLEVEAKWNERFKAYYCPACGTWLSPRCARSYCSYCKGRPDKAALEEGVS